MLKFRQGGEEEEEEEAKRNRPKRETQSKRGERDLCVRQIGS